jgi:predicted DCC family thiol-disulfide oxidoreductase YuxK
VNSILFDGECGLCSRFVRIVVKRDTHRVFTFIPLQSETGRRIRQDAGVPESCDSVVLVDSSGRAYVRSKAVRRIFELLNYKWTARVLSLIPTFLADAAYGLIARFRLLFFDRADSCVLPDR